MNSQHPDQPGPGERGLPEKGEQPEIRYVPVDYLPEFHDTADDEIDPLELIGKIWEGRFTILKITAAFIALGIFWALFSPEEYESEAILMPEVPQQQAGGTSRLLQQFGLGGRIGGMGAEPGMIPPMIYPEIVNSLSFQRELMVQELNFQDYEIRATWPEFINEHYKTPLTSRILNATVFLPATAGKWFRQWRGEEREVRQVDGPVIRIGRDEFEQVEELRNRITVRENMDNGLLTIRVKLQDPQAAAELNHYLTERLKEYVIAYRTEKASQNLQFAEEQLQNAKTRFEETQMRLAEFMDQNIDIATARAATELERLQDEKNLALQVYSSLAQRVEEERLNLQEQMPVFTEVQGASVPTNRSEPRRALMVIIFTLLGGILSVAWVLMRPLLKSLNPGGNEQEMVD